MIRQFRKDGYIAIGRELEHRIVYKQHFGPIPEGFDVHHKNGIRNDNRIENLECLRRGDHRREHSEAYQRSSGEWVKICRVCLETKSLSEFYQRKKGPTSFLTLCKDCTKRETRNRYAENPDLHKKYQKTWYRNNPDKVKEINAQRSVDPVHKERQHQRDVLRWADPEIRAKAQARLRAWQKAHPEKTREYNARARAKRMEQDHG
jgi:superfamily II helicase